MFLKIIIYFLIITSCLNSNTSASEFKQALPGYKLVFPNDNANHEDYKTEWWYYTGHLQTKSSKKYGFELTFFRQGISRDNSPTSNLDLNLKDVYITHFAITDLNNHTFHFYQKLNRNNSNIALSSNSEFFVKNENWLAESLGKNFYISANSKDFSLHLLLEPQKQPIIHGLNGVSQKGSKLGQASHYYSYSRLKATGLIFNGSSPERVSGLAWMDHEFGSNQLDAKQTGWDWVSIQLDNNYELMLYLMRNNDKTYDTNSSGTIIFPDGSYQHLKLSEFTIKTAKTWRSSRTNANYPSQWEINVPKYKISLTVIPEQADQELVTTESTNISYLEGSSKVNGKFDTKSVSGHAYVELTGYAKNINLKKL